MDLYVNTVRGTCKVPSVDPSTTVEQLKALLHHSLDARWGVPDPEHQNLVYKGRKLRDQGGSLSSSGISNGESLAVVRVNDIQRPDSPEDEPTPDMAAINTAISEYAKAHGLQEKLNAPEEPQPGRRRVVRASAGTLGQLQSLIDALEGRLDALETAAVGQARQEEVAEVQIPEPNAEHMNTLRDMGFSEVLASNALLLCRNNLEPALNWILQRGNDPAAAVPIPQEQLRRLYATRPRAVQSRQVDASLVAQLQEMGFAEEQAARALRTFNNNIEVSVAWLVRITSSQQVGASQPAGSSQEQGELQEAGERQEERQQGDRIYSEPSNAQDAEQYMAVEQLPTPPGRVEDMEQATQEEYVGETSLSTSEGFPDVDAPAVSPSGEDAPIGLDIAAPMDTPSLGASLPTLEMPYVPMDEEEPDHHEEAVALQPSIGELHGLDLDDLERILGADPNVEMHPALQQVLTLEGVSSPDALDGASIPGHSLEVASSLDEMLNHAEGVGRVRGTIRALDAQRERTRRETDEEAGGGPGPSGESPEGRS
ncbi:unnamed protein product [Ostreobium quekettii]|uniref:Uncharacterized protein n=1 Tax=Ostreobium quekettii TaxID=121088 RepID=A0A8S1J795_9CHLO|nr:unnamed protein product [Ostreobium quekettii]|eukprot:evm.model.scf_1102.5 EVM.evm.TU.scf_1102.5   scf_1102:31658-36554(-)